MTPPPDLLQLPARGELAPQIQATAADEMSRRVEDVDFDAWQELQLARDMEARLPGFRAEGNRQRLDHYRKVRQQRGEEPFQYLDKALARRQREDFQTKLPNLVTMFSGADKFDQAFPEEHRAAISERFAGSMDPARDKMQTANLMLVAEMTGKPVEELQKLWPAYRNQYAKERLGAQGTVDDAGFYALAGKKLAGEKADGELAESIQNEVRRQAIGARPLGEALATAKTMAGERWKEFEPAARASYARVLSDFDDREISTARELFEQGNELLDQIIAVAE